MNALNTYLVHHEHIPDRAAYPVIDAHNHLWGDWSNLNNIISVMDTVGVVCYADLTANVSISWGKGGYILGQGNIEDFYHNCADVYPGRFYGFTTATFAQPIDKPLFSDSNEFVEKTIDVLRAHVKRGARGLKILKELGLHYRDHNGNLIHIDNPCFDPVWDEAGKLGIPILMHQADPCGFFQPVTPENEHYDTMLKYPSWSFADLKFPRFEELLERRDRVIKKHRNTIFLLAHVANYPVNLAAVSRLLDNNPNVFIDFSARIDELGRQPYTSREFLIHYQDRVVFGTDMPVSLEMYRCYFRFLETRDEYFIYPDYDGTFGRFRWHIYGLGLPGSVLEKIYYKNALKLIPGLM